MTILYPLGLLGLIGVPVLILIYIIKNKYTERTIPSTYLWTLSEKFIKRRVPINRLTGIISLILQILAVICLSFALAHPILTLKNSAYEYVFVLDGSGSMNFVEEGGKTRFELGKERIEELIKDSSNGSTYRIILAGDTTQTIYETDPAYKDDGNEKERAILVLDELSEGYTASELTDARKQAQAYFDENHSSKIYLVTDKAYEETANIELINVATPVENYALSDVSYELTGSGLRITGKAMSYESDKIALGIYLYMEDATEYNDMTTVDLVKLEESEFLIVYSYEGVESFTSFRIVIGEKDALMLDNEVTVYNVLAENISKTLIVSDAPFFIRAALVSTGVAEMEIVTTEKYKEATYTGYGLYIFDGYAPAALPDDGAVWFFNPKGSVAGTNFSFQGDSDDRPASPYVAGYSTSTNSQVRNLLDGVTRRDFALPKFVKCGLNAGFTQLALCDGYPIIFAGTNAYGYREAVFAFDLHGATEFTFSDSFTTLVANLISYSFPTVIEETAYTCGDTMLVNVIAGVQSIKITSPLGKESYPDTSVAISEIQLTEVGTYHIELTMKDGSTRTLNAYASMPTEECVPTGLAESFVLEGESEDIGSDGFYDILMILFIVLAVIVVADFGVYCYEQYQLR